jgi:hypothetical protein
MFRLYIQANVTRDKNKTRRKRWCGNVLTRKIPNKHETYCKVKWIMSTFYEDIITIQNIQLFNYFHEASSSWETDSHSAIQENSILRNATVYYPVHKSWVPVASTCFHAGISLGLFIPGDGGDMFLRNVSWLSTDYTALYPRWWYLQSTMHFKIWCMLFWSSI